MAPPSSPDGLLDNAGVVTATNSTRQQASGPVQGDFTGFKDQAAIKMMDREARV